MTESTMTSKGQVTIPKAVREALRLQAGDRLEFVISESGKVLMTPVKTTVAEIYGMLHKPDQEPVTVEAMDEAIKSRLGS